MTAGDGKRCATRNPIRRGQDNRRRLYRKLIGAAHATRAALLAGRQPADRLYRHRGRALARPGGAIICR